MTDLDWESFASNGFLHLGRVLDAKRVVALAERADALALGSVLNPEIQLQQDTGGDYDELGPIVDRLDESPSDYRKIQGLEHDELFGELVRHPMFLGICAQVYGRHVPISLFRAMVMNKPAGRGTHLPWHQDAGAVWALDRDPTVTIWVALDDATPENGCVEVMPGSHRLGLLSWFGSTVSDQVVARHYSADDVLPLEVEAGHAVLIHNWTLHRSGVNPSSRPRRAVTCCYMDGRTRNQLTGELFPLVFGQVPGEPPVYLDHVRRENAVLRESRASAEEYALSLEAECRRLQAEFDEYRGYTRHLENELRRLHGELHAPSTR